MSENEEVIDVKASETNVTESVQAEEETDKPETEPSNSTTNTDTDADPEVSPVNTAVSEDHDWDKISDDIPEDIHTAQKEEQEQEKEETPSGPTALQIVSIGTETDEYAFTFHKEALEEIMNKVPSDLKVCVVSVVGAFRTGKSFLLSWFLRYLSHLEQLDESSENEDKNWFDEIDSLGNNGFHWRGGAERNTTGIWMWSKPFILPRNARTGEKVALLLVDTQGMFDHETTMGLTAAIFGLSTLLSSYQIYNVDKRIQEDNLQQLALFSEYGRMALQSDQDRDALQKNDSEEDFELTVATKPKPFQKIEFLVRDWQNFEDDEDLDACEVEMKEYLEKVIAERQAADLKDTREQITSCFEELSCFLITHPGFAVTKKKYEGDTSVVDPTFKAFMDRYCQKVFGNLVAKSIHGRELSAAELSAYIQNYAQMFASGAYFPEAATMLEATANANNSNATIMAVKRYKEKLDEIVGPRVSNYMDPNELEEFHQKMYQECISSFESIANFGSARAIQEAKNEVIKSIEESYDLYSKLNQSRNPLFGLETYIIPLTVGFVSAVLRWITDFTCSSWSQTCAVGSEVLSHIYQVVFFFLVIIAFTKSQQIRESATKMKKAFDVMNDDGGKKKKD